MSNPRLTIKRNVVVLCLVPLALAAAGCGSKSKSSSTSTPAPPASTPTPQSTGSGSAGGSGSVSVAADKGGALAFDQKTLTAKAGKVTIVMANPKSSGVQHGIGINGNGVDKDGKTVPAGATSSVTLALKPGKYTFYCPVSGHKAAGMKGTLTVQ